MFSIQRPANWLFISCVAVALVAVTPGWPQGSGTAGKGTTSIPQKRSAAPPPPATNRDGAGPAGVLSQSALRSALIELYGPAREDELTALVRETIDGSKRTASHNETQKQEVLNILARAAMKQGSGMGRSFPDIQPLSPKAPITVAVNDALKQSTGVQVSGTIRQGGQLQVDMVATILDSSARASRSLVVGTGRYFAQEIKAAAYRDIRASVTLMSLRNDAGGWTVSGYEDVPGKVSGQYGHLLISELPEQSILFENATQPTLVFPAGAGTVYRFSGRSATLFRHYVFFGDDDDHFLTFILLPGKGLTYLCGKGSAYRDNAVIKTF